MYLWVDVLALKDVAKKNYTYEQIKFIECLLLLLFISESFVFPLEN
jgi:hypothetical protein